MIKNVSSNILALADIITSIYVAHESYTFKLTIHVLHRVPSIALL